MLYTGHQLDNQPRVHLSRDTHQLPRRTQSQRVALAGLVFVLGIAAVMGGIWAVCR